MQTIYVGEQRNGRIKLTSDRDCLAPDIIRFEERVFTDDKELMRAAYALENRGFRVCVDTEKIFYETLVRTTPR